MNLPKRKKRVRSGIRDDDGPIRCPGHLKWVRGHECSVAGGFTTCGGRIEAHHLQEFRAVEGGIGLKVGDDKTVPLCSTHHAGIHNVGQTQFETAHSRALRPVSESLWKQSPHGRKYRLENGE